MDERKFRILQAIIDDYILTGVPVGSRTISKKYETSLSSATIRNEMSDLEELGYLDQPHVSAGRIPSAKAYRLYVDELLRSGQIPDADAKSIRGHFTRRMRHMEDVVEHAAKVLSSLTNYTALVMSPQGQTLRIRNIQLVPVTETSALVIIVTDGGIVKDAMIRIPEGLDGDALYAISRMLTEKLSGKEITEVARELGPETVGMQQSKQLLASIAQLAAQVEEEASTAQVMVGGGSKILSYPEYSDVEKARSFLSLLEAKDKLAQLLMGQGEMAFTVRIGPEVGIDGMQDISMVSATYAIGSHAQGTIGVIGPTRMHYSRVLSILSTMGKQLGDIIEDTGQDDGPADT